MYKRPFYVKIIVTIILIIACILPGRALTLAKRLMQSSDFDPDLLPVITQWTLSTGAIFDNNNTTIKLTNAGTQQCLAYYTYTLNQTVAKPIRFAAESCSQEVAFVTASMRYALRVDVIYNDDTEELCRYVPFSGSSAWESKSFIFCPRKPVKSVNVIVMLYNLAGSAWFRNITMQVQSNEASSNFGKFGDTAVFNETNTEGYLVREFSAGEDWYEISDGESGNNWELEAASNTSNGMTIHTATLINHSLTARSGVLTYRIPLTGSDFRWCDADMRTQTLMYSLDYEYTNEDGILANAKSYSELLWGGVVNDTGGYAIAVDPNYPCQFKIRYSLLNQELFIMFDLGFTASGNASDNATVKFAVWEFDPEFGIRQAIHDFYRLYPDYFSDRIVKQGGEHGIWCFSREFSANSIPDINDFGFKLDQNPYLTESILYDDCNDIYTTLYVAPWELRIYGADLPGWPNPAYADVVERLNDLYSLNDPTAIAIVNSGSKDSSGKYVYLTTAEWSPNHIRFQCNPAPGIRPSIYDFDAASERNAYYDQWKNPDFQSKLVPGTWDGIICDNVNNIYWSACDEKTKINYDSSHLNKMTTPLIHDQNGVVGISIEAMIWEYFYNMRQDIDDMTGIDKRLRIMQANGSQLPFAGTLLDVHGSEQVWDRGGVWNPPTEKEMLEYRAKAGRKAVVFIQNPYEHNIGTNSAWQSNSRSQKYFARCCAFGIMPSFGITDAGASTGMEYFDDAEFYEIDRNLFATYIPVIRKLSQAGWEPLRQTSVNDDEVFLERFGSEYITVFNPSSSSKTVTVNYLPVNINITGKELISDNNVSWINGQTTLTIASESVAVLEIPCEINFKIDEGSGDSVATANPYGITGTSYNTSWTDGVDGMALRALDFNGFNSYISIPGDNLLRVNDDGLTYAAWVKPETLNPSGHNMVFSHNGGHYLSVCSKKVYLKITTEHGAHYCYSSATLNEGNWYHIAATYDRTGYMKVYINGRQDGAIQGPFFNPQNLSSACSAGSYGASGYFDGTIDDIQICRRGLNAREIRRLKDKAIIAYCFPLNEGSGSVAVDNFDPGKQANIYGASWNGNADLDKKNDALYFDGINDYADIAGSGAGFTTANSNGFTFGARVKANSLNAIKPVISRGNTAIYLTDGKVYFRTLIDGTLRWSCSPGPVLDNDWHYIAAVYEADGYMKVYIDGVLNNTTGPYLNPTNEPSYNIQIGTWGGNYFDGIIGNVRIYNKALTGDEISLLYENRE